MYTRTARTIEPPGSPNLAGVKEPARVLAGSAREVLPPPQTNPQGLKHSFGGAGFSQTWKAVIEGGWGAAVALAKTERKSLKGRLAK